MNKQDCIYVAGHRGLVGSSIVRKLREQGYSNLLVKDRSQLDLTNQLQTENFFRNNSIDYVILAAARVGGIMANSTLQTEFLYDNLMISANVISSAARAKVKKLLLLGSSCIYPRESDIPISEESLLSGPLEPTNEGYAIAKIAGLKLCEKFNSQYGKRFISAMPCNLYGPGDNFHPEHSHVIPGLLRRFHEAKLRKSSKIKIWGSGTPRREFLYVDDLARVVVLLMNEYESEQTINIGASEDISILELAEKIAQCVGFEGTIETDPTMPDGTQRKLLNSDKVRKLGWKPLIPLEVGLHALYSWALETGQLSDSFGASETA